jgi:asparagine N-glycosylation enzyme membrane subunit Stt3
MLAKLKEAVKQLLIYFLMWILVIMFLFAYLLYSNAIYQGRYYAGDDSYYLYK